MNTELAKSIAISEILGKLNISPENPGKKELRYFSPWRNEKTPSFYVNVDENIWFDHGEGIGGGLIKFASTYLERLGENHTNADAVRWLTNLSGSFPDCQIFDPVRERNAEKKDSALVLKSNRPITHLGLIRYLEKRGIPLSLAKQNFREMHVVNRNTGKRIISLGFGNEDGGFELRNPMFKACLRPKAISFIRGKVAKPESIHLFEGCMDYVSVIAQLNGKPLKGDAIVLNSVALLKQAMAYIHKYGYRTAYSWMDNDAAGKKATAVLAEFLKEEECLTHVKMNNVYAPHKDVNAWHMHQLKLS
ncbi:toprim domain-containing protein [Dyadobacter bucti]|uniref:toprim domain-containing protein n=1 Tax=Dyadobacter bucti TaxID=2572203 RepID=UPI0011089844|nr:toprim domain-containing protein [Dyadobacter bucti]